MGVMSEIAGTLPEKYLHDNLIFKYLINKKVEESDAKAPWEFRKFFYDLLPDVPEDKKLKYHMYVSEDKVTYTDLKYDDLYDYINALYKMSQYDCYNVFFSLTPYRYERKTKSNATQVKGFFIDIDDLDFDVMSMSKEDIIEFLTTEYNVPKSLLPQYVTKSGHGLHLFMVLYDPFKNEAVREKYARSLVTHYKADFSSSLITQNIRTPMSYNVKAVPIKTELIRINERSGFNLSDLDYFLKSEEEIEKHRAEENAKTMAKRRATMAANQAERIANGEPANPRKSYKKKKADTKSTEKTEEPVKSDKIPKPIDVSNFEYYHNFSKNARNWNLIMDLHNYFIRHEGDIYGLRAKFFTIMATYSTYIMDEDKCKEFLSGYADDDFQSELEEIVRFIYKKASQKEKYTYRYEKIAEILCFTEEDIRMSYCSFSEERRVEATKNRKKRAAEKKKAATATKKRNRTNYVRENFSKSNAELALECQVSERTISRIRATIINEVA